MNETIKDSGEMQEFSTGAHRDSQNESKGRLDLVPIEYAAMAMNDPVLHAIGEFMKKREVSCLADALRMSVDTLKCFNYSGVQEFLKENGIENELPDDSDDRKFKACLAHMILEVSKQFAEGGKKYGFHNWSATCC